jgi:hypothetical protein
MIIITASVFVIFDYNPEIGEIIFAVNSNLKKIKGDVFLDNWQTQVPFSL